VPVHGRPLSGNLGLGSKCLLLAASGRQQDLRHTFASLGRTAGESAFNVARIMGHARSTLVDQVYAHTMQSGMASVAENVTARALGLKPCVSSRAEIRETLDGR